MKLKLLKEPYPFDESPKKHLVTAVLFGLFVFLFLFFFEPFGLSNYQSENKAWHLLGYGAVTACSLLFSYHLFRLVFPNWFSKESWNVGKNILYSTWMFFFIGSSNLAYSVSLDFLRFDLNGFLFYQGMTVLVGLFPVTLSTFIVYNRRLKEAVEIANSLNQSTKNTTEGGRQIEINSNNKSESFKLSLNQVYAIKSMENYIEVFYDEDGKQRKTIRNTISKIDTDLKDISSLKRCHRSYIVNLEKVSSFRGNAQGLSLSLVYWDDFIIPVSRQYVSSIKESLSK